MKLFRAALVVALAAAAGCKGDDTEGANAAAVPIDTTNESQWDGSSTQHVQKEAEALTPEQAEARGLAVDTTIHLENLSSSDSTPPGATQPGAPNPGAQAGARADTAAPLPETNPTAQPAQGAPQRP